MADFAKVTVAKDALSRLQESINISIIRIKRMGSILPCCLPCGKTGELQILCCQGFEVNAYNFSLDAPAWRDHTSDLISFGVRLGSEALRLLQR